jgi:hypothetical protein
MPSDDRERSFEAALANHLRATSGSQPAACSDAETLAAYHEGSLIPEQVASLKTHLTGCSRCQEILAHLAATDEIPLAEANIGAAKIAATKTVHVLPARRPTLWRWVAPAGAIAAALLVWVAVRENSPLQNTEKGPILEAKRGQSAPPSSSLSPTPPSGDSTQAGRAPSDSLQELRAAPQAKPLPVPKLPESLLKRKELSSAAKKATPSENFGELADGSRRSRITADLGTSAEVAKNQATKSDARAESEEKTFNPRQDASSTDSKQPTPTRSQIAAAAPPAAPAPPPDSANARVLSESAGVSGSITQQQEMAGMSRYKQKAEMRLANSIGDVTISAPGGHPSWRVGQAGVIAFSSDAKKTWTVQPTGVIADLLAGSATSDQVCWVVGRAGTILRTTDAGAHWQKVRPPTQDNFRSVVAEDDRQATVSASSGKYQTTDGGIIWHKLPPE